MATVPLSGTNIVLFSGVPFNQDYKHSRWFDTLADQQAYFARQTVVANVWEANFQRIDGHPYVRINKSVDELWNVNYLQFQNATFNKTFYAFVTKIEYIQKGTTHVHFDIDVLQTWRFEMNFKPSYVIREHCQLWNADGSPVVNTVDEGLNYGTDYDVAFVQHYKPYDDLFFMVVVSKKIMHSSSTADSSGYAFSVNGLPQALNYYILPFKLDGSTPACNIKLTDLVGGFLISCYKSTDAVNNIVSIYITDTLPDHSPYDGTTLTLNTSYYQQATIGSANCVYVHNIPYSVGVANLGPKYAGFTAVTESKMLMYPYTVTILDDFKGNRIELKNEYIANSEILLDIKGSLGVGNKTVYTIKDYLMKYISDDTVKDLINMEHSLIDSNPNDLPVLVDSLAAYIQGNRNSIQAQKNSIWFNGVANTTGSAVGAVGAAATGNVVGAAQGVVGAASGAGNTVLKLQAIQAKQNDINNIPPSIAKMGSNAYFDYGNGYTGVWLIKKQITTEYRKKLTDFFSMYGYKRNEVKYPNFHTRKYWNYIQTLNCNITGPFNNDDLEELKAVFDNGITLWHTDDVANYTPLNEVIAND